MLYHLLQGTMRFSELRRKLPAVTQRMLTRQLESAELILRTIYAEVPPRVEHSLTTGGESLRPAILVLRAWGAKLSCRLARGRKKGGLIQAASA